MIQKVWVVTEHGDCADNVMGIFLFQKTADAFMKKRVEAVFKERFPCPDDGEDPLDTWPGYSEEVESDLLVPEHEVMAKWVQEHDLWCDFWSIQMEEHEVQT